MDICILFSFYICIQVILNLLQFTVKILFCSGEYQFFFNMSPPLALVLIICISSLYTCITGKLSACNKQLE